MDFQFNFYVFQCNYSSNYLYLFLVIFFSLMIVVWADHGDDISLQYAGTPALKRDLVRYLLLLFISHF